MFVSSLMLCHFHCDLGSLVTAWKLISTTMMLRARRCVVSRQLLGFAGLTTTPLGSVVQEPFNDEGVLIQEPFSYQPLCNEVFRYAEDNQFESLIM